MQKKLDELGGLQIDDFTGRIVNDDDVKRLEQHIGAALPNGYREFILKYGSGQAHFDQSVGFPLQIHPDGAFGINVFFGGVPLENFYCYDLISHYDLTRTELPSDAIPIADDGVGNYVCLKLSGDDAGSIYFWDHEEYITEDEPTYTYMQYLVPSFEEFVNKLQIQIWD